MICQNCKDSIHELCSKCDCQHKAPQLKVTGKIVVERPDEVIVAKTLLEEKGYVILTKSQFNELCNILGLEIR